MTTSEKTETHTQKPRPNTHKNKTQAKSHQMKAYLLKMAASLTTKRCVRETQGSTKTEDTLPLPSTKTVYTTDIYRGALQKQRPESRNDNQK